MGNARCVGHRRVGDQPEKDRAGVLAMHTPLVATAGHGDLDATERALTSKLAGRASAETYLLRGCTRYTRAMLSAGRLRAN